MNGERDIYVLELILAMRRQDWIWTEEVHVINTVESRVFLREIE